MTRRLSIAALIIVLAGSAWIAAQTANMKIVVIEGEGAVNVIRQKTAVVPLVEVRDRNDQPVAGAVVTFAVRGGRATFNGARTLSVTTNAAGRATATGFTPTGTGTLQIGASASFQGQSAAVVISQTNVLTAAGAATAGTATAGAATGAGAAAGTGVATSTIAIAGAAVGGGTLVAAKALGGKDAPSTTANYSGPISVPITFTITRLPGHPLGAGSCNDDRTMIGSITVTLNDPTASPLSGTAHSVYTQTSVGGTCGGSGSSTFDLGSAPVTGTPANLTFTLNRTVTNGTSTVFDIIVYTGAVSGNTITGSVNYSGGMNAPQQQNAGSLVFPVTLTRQ